MRERVNYPCEAPEHVLNCICLQCVKRNCSQCRRLTEDHFTPRCIAKLYGWSRNQVNDSDNLQYLSPQCHRAKDFSTPARLQQLRAQLKKNKTIKFREHVT